MVPDRLRPILGNSDGNRDVKKGPPGMKPAGQLGGREKQGTKPDTRHIHDRRAGVKTAATRHLGNLGYH